MLEPSAVLKKYVSPSALSFFYKDSLQTQSKIAAVVSQLHARGFLTASPDSFTKSKDTLWVQLFLGNVYKKAVINTSGVSMLALRRSGLKSIFPEIHKFSFKEFYKMEKRLVDFYQTIGFPFAYVFVDSIQVEANDCLKGKLRLVQGPFVVFDSLQIVGKTKTKSKFLSNYTRIAYGSPFNQATVDNAHKLLKQLPYLKVNDVPVVAFRNEKAQTNFYLEDRKANQIDGVAGFLPNQQATAGQNKLIVTGEFNMNLKNMGGKGKGMRIEWRRLKPLSQQISLEYFHPNLFNSPMNFMPMFDLIKQDTTFQTVTAMLKTNFNLSGSSKMGFYVGSKQSRLLSTKQYSAFAKPPFLDFNLTTYGAEYEWNDLDDYFYPKKGNWIALEGNVGIKEVLSNARLPEILFTGVRKTTTQFYSRGEFRHFFRTGKNSTLLTGLKGGRVFNDNILLTNDLFQLGGLKTLRGFNENFFFSEYYSTATLEFRQFTDESSYLLLFAEKSYMQYRVGTDSVEDWPMGIGAGLSLSTNTGIFNFVYSLGQAAIQKMQFNQSKIHFGYITRF